LKIFLTGHTGFIGSELYSLLKYTHFSVISLERDDLKTKDSIHDFFKLHHANSDDLLIHLACVGVNTTASLEDCLKFNLLTSLNLCNVACEFGIAKYVFTGSCFEYGLSGNTINFLDEDSNLLPTGSYATSKVISYYALKELFSNKNAVIAYLRLFQVYGESESENRLFPSLLKAAKSGSDFEMSDGEQIRDFIHVSHVINYIFRLIENFQLYSNFNIFNVCSGVPTSVKDFANYHWARVNARGKIFFGRKNRKNEFARIVGTTNKIDNAKIVPFELYTHL
jgi:nucleoside-diphosphate-sugar epimerase